LELGQLGLYIVPPIAGTIIGYFTNDIAIKMLFRPYKALYIGKYQLPFTPGLIPSNQGRLAQRISDTIMGSLLTPTELQKIARRLLQVERVKIAITWLLKLGLDQLELDKEQKTAQVLANILQDLFSESLPRLIKVWSRRRNFLEPQIDQIFDRLIFEFQLTDEQSKQLADWLLDVILSPEVIRIALVDFLTDRNIQVIDDGLKERSSGTYWVVANLVGMRNSLVKLRTFCLDEKEQTNEIIGKLVTQLKIRENLQEWLLNLSLQNLPLSTIKQLRKTLDDSIRNYLQTTSGQFIKGLSDSFDWNGLAVIIISRLRNSSILTSSLGIVSEELAIIIDRYLEKDIETIITQVIPILSIDQVIIDRIKSTSPAELEEGINGIVRTELQSIVNLGGILGLIVGLLQTLTLWLQR
jgi:uncharacterized membrane protein YheB (UPF0754 family)